MLSAYNVSELFTQKRVLIIGDVMVDSYLWGKVERISPEAPVPIVSVQNRERRLGGAANVALNIKSLGAMPILCSIIGNDVDGDTLIELAKEAGMGTDGIVRSAHRISTVKHRIISGSQHMLRVDSEVDTPANAEEEQQLITAALKLVPECDVVIFEDYDKGSITPNIITAITNACIDRNIPVVVDPKKRNFLAYKRVSLFKPNLKELKEGMKLDFKGDFEHDLVQASDALKEKLEAQGTLITLSERGVYIDYKNEKARFSAHKREIADVSGAGDTVISVAALCLACGFDAPTTASLSNLAGGLVCEYVGVVPVAAQKFFEEAQELGILS